MEILFLVMIFILGLCCGSFVNMLVYRTAERYELESRKFKVKSKARSFCDYCGKQLRWYENVPVISWLVQKGKTRCCDKKLPVLYPIVELGMGLLFFLYGLKFSIFDFNIFTWILGLIIIVFLMFSAVFDLKYMILPDFSTIILTVCSLIIWFVGYSGNWSYLWSGFISFLFLGFLYLVTKKKGMGFGDVKLAIFMGLFLNINVVIAFYIAFIIGALMALFLMAVKKVSKKTAIPFGPFLILGTLVTWFWGQELANLSVFQFIR